MGSEFSEFSIPIFILNIWLDIGYPRKINRPHHQAIDHKPEDVEEKKRIEANGGRVFAVQYDDGVDGPARVWWKHMDIPASFINLLKSK